MIYHVWVDADLRVEVSYQSDNRQPDVDDWQSALGHFLRAGGLAPFTCNIIELQDGVTESK